MTKIKYLGFAGKAFSGKTTVAKMVAGMFPNAVVRPIAFYLKTTALSLGWNGEKDERGRRLLQDLGQCFRDYDRGTWIDYWTRKVEPLTGYGGMVIADDVRYDNEAERIFSLGGSIVLMDRPGGPVLEGAAGEHPSENGLTNFDGMARLVNVEGLDRLDFNVWRIVSDLNEGLDIAGKTYHN